MIHAHHILQGLLSLTFADSSYRAATSSLVTTAQDSREHFKAIVLDAPEVKEDAKLQRSIELRFPQTPVSWWKANLKDIEPPFVLVQIRFSSELKNTTLRLLTHEGSIYSRSIATNQRSPHWASAVARELSSLLMAIEEGLIEPDNLSDTESAPPIPQQESSGEETSTPTEAPRDAPQGPQAQAPQPALPAPGEPSPPLWRWLGAVYWSLTPPVPRFELWHAGFGLEAQAKRRVSDKLFLHAGLGWKHKQRLGLRIHRLHFLFGASTRWPVPRIKANYNLVGMVSLEPWWVRANSEEATQNPRPKGSSLLLGLVAQQSLLFPIYDTGQRTLQLGPALRLGYSGGLGDGFSAIGIYARPPQNQANAVLRLGGLHAEIGLGVEF